MLPAVLPVASAAVPVVLALAQWAAVVVAVAEDRFEAVSARDLRRASNRRLGDPSSDQIRPNQVPAVPRLGRVVLFPNLPHRLPVVVDE